MRMSCNGCRVLRKGCSDDCSIRPCLEWIKSPESQANATVFLAKFYGRAGLMNLINAGPAHLRPAIFRSLLYEACGRMVNPIYGSVGLMNSGDWQLCQNAVQAVLTGAPITRMPIEAAEADTGPPLKVSCDIRHVARDMEDNSSDLHRVRNRRRFKRSGAKKNLGCVWNGSCEETSDEGVVNRNRSPSHESSLSHQSDPVQESHSDPAEFGGGGNSELENRASDEGEIELDLSLGFEPVKPCVKGNKLNRSGGTCNMSMDGSDQSLIILAL